MNRSSTSNKQRTNGGDFLWNMTYYYSCFQDRNGENIVGVTNLPLAFKSFTKFSFSDILVLVVVSHHCVESSEAESHSLIFFRSQPRAQCAQGMWFRDYVPRNIYHEPAKFVTTTKILSPEKYPLYGISPSSPISFFHVSITPFGSNMI